MNEWIHSKLLQFLTKLMTIVFVVCSIGLANSNSPEGFASVSALGLDGTTGGAGGNIVTVTNAADFVNYAWDTEPLIIQVADTIELTSMVGINSNKTIIGVGDQGVINGGGFHISDKSNIIIRNLLFRNSLDDAINIQESSHHIWIDHCDLTNAYDGLIDIKRGSDYITVSWNKFYNHQKTCLLGHSDNNGAQDSTHLLVTYHHNWFNGTNSRHPRVRFSGLTHVYNNYYNNNGYGIASTMDAEVLVEGNYFYFVNDPTLVGYGSSGPGDLVEQNNIFDNCGNNPETRGTVPSPPYTYQLDDAASIPAIVPADAGRVGFITGIKDDVDIFADSYELNQNYPNPFNPTTTIEYTLSKPGKIKLSVFNTLGQEVLTLVNGYMEQGTHHVLVGASQLSSGVYYYSLQAGSYSQVRKMILLK
jgi:pectate lyase